MHHRGPDREESSCPSRRHALSVAEWRKHTRTNACITTGGQPRIRGAERCIYVRYNWKSIHLADTMKRKVSSAAGRGIKNHELLALLPHSSPHITFADTKNAHEGHCSGGWGPGSSRCTAGARRHVRRQILCMLPSRDIGMILVVASIQAPRWRMCRQRCQRLGVPPTRASARQMSAP